MPVKIAPKLLPAIPGVRPPQPSMHDTGMATSTFTLASIDLMPNRTSTPSVFAGRAWQQVLARDAAADGQFVYAVKSTGIFCRPSCPSRRPERKNVSFFPTPALAEAAGFRPCLRCEPTRVSPKADPQAKAIAKAVSFLTEHAGERTKLDDLAAAAGLGKFALQRGFKRVLGVTPGDFAREQRKDRFRNKVRTPRLSITDAVYEAGFGSSSRLYEGVDQALGMSPTAMKSGGAGETIHYTTTSSPLGRLLVATTARGLCAILFADSDAEAAVELRALFPQAVLRPSTSDAALTEAVTFVLSRLTEHPPPRPSPSTSAPPPSSSAYGKPSGKFLAAKPAPTPRSPKQSAPPSPSAPSAPPAAPTCSPSSSPATVSSARTASSPATAGASTANVSYWLSSKSRARNRPPQPNVRNRVEAYDLQPETELSLHLK